MPTVINLAEARTLPAPSTELWFGWDQPAKTDCEIQVVEGLDWVTIQEMPNKRNFAIRTGISRDQSLGQVPRMIVKGS